MFLTLHRKIHKKPWQRGNDLGFEYEQEPKRDPETGIRPISQWGPECSRGFVRDARFGPGQVIKGTNRSKSRKNRPMVNWDNGR